MNEWKGKISALLDLCFRAVVHSCETKDRAAEFILKAQRWNDGCFLRRNASTFPTFRTSIRVKVHYFALTYQEIHLTGTSPHIKQQSCPSQALTIIQILSSRLAISRLPHAQALVVPHNLPHPGTYRKPHPLILLPKPASSPLEPIQHLVSRAHAHVPRAIAVTRAPTDHLSDLISPNAPLQLAHHRHEAAVDLRRETFAIGEFVELGRRGEGNSLKRVGSSAPALKVDGEHMPDVCVDKALGVFVLLDGLGGEIISQRRSIRYVWVAYLWRINVQTHPPPPLKS